MEENKKKVLVPTIIAVVTLVVLTIGATYAYFKVATDNNFGTPKIEASTPSIGSVALSTGSNLTMNLTAEQMMQVILEDYEECIELAEKMEETPEEWGCYDYLKSPLYYASPSGTTTESYTENVGTATVSGDGIYNCTYTLTIDDNENSLYDTFQTYTNKSTGQVVLTVNGVTYDFNTADLFPLTIDGEMSGLTSSVPQYITARLKLKNTGKIDQSNLANQDITLTFGVEDFSCTAVEEQEQSQAVQYILANASEDELWDSTLEDDGYRYVGTNPDNYVCFGYNDAETDCDFTNSDNTDKYAYRVIGIFEDSNSVEHVKLIKKEALNTQYAWHEEYNSDIDWNESDLYDKINGDIFLTNATYMPEGWSKKIATWNYTMTNALSDENNGPYYQSETVQNIYLHEMNRSTKTNANGEWKTTSGKIGLMYVSDYLLSLGSSALEYTYENSNALKTGWMYISNNDAGTFELTMSRHGYAFDYIGYAVWGISYGGSVDYFYLNNTYSTRPVFYLTSDITMSGEGTIESPFIVNK